MADRLDFEWRVVAISTRRHGSVIDPGGVDIARALSLVESGQSLDRLGGEPRARSGLDVIRQAARALADDAADGRVVCIESTVLDIDQGEPAVAHVRAALEAQMHVVTVNKGPAAFAYDALESLADTMDRVFFFEGAVMDGIPVFNLVRETMPAVRIDGFRGAINTTSNFILSALERGQAFDDAVREMQARGIAEADPSLDVDGWDAAAKTAALVNVLMGGSITPHQVARTGIADVKGDDLRDAISRGRRIRLVASATRQDGGIVARVEPEMLAAGDPLAGLGRHRERVVPAHRPAWRSRHRAARRHADADGLCGAERCVAHQPAAERLERPMTGPLTGTTVLDLTRVLSRPSAR